MVNVLYENIFESVNVEILEESYNPTVNEGKMKFKAKLQEKDALNNNGRRYPEETLREIVRQLSPKATERKLVGELDHPTPQGDTAAKMKRASTIALQDSCVIYTSIEFDGTFITATCETLSNSKGNDLYRLLKDKVTIGFSLRAFGETMRAPDGTITIPAAKIKALTYDVVSNPSHSSSVISEFITESENIALDESSLVEIAVGLQSFKSEISTKRSILEEGGMIHTDINSSDGSELCLNGECALKTISTLNESIDYLMNLSLESQSIKYFDFKL